MKLEDKEKLNQCLDILGETDLGLPLVWLYTWDVIQDILTDGEWEVLVTMDEAWNNLVEAVKADQGFSLEFGSEQLYDDVRDWMFNREMIRDFEDRDV